MELELKLIVTFMSLKRGFQVYKDDSKDFYVWMKNLIKSLLGYIISDKSTEVPNYKSMG